MRQIDRSVKDIFGKLDNLFPDLATTTSPVDNNNSPLTSISALSRIIVIIMSG